jgi:hypothetical protein
MHRSLRILSLALLLPMVVYGNGVAIIDATNGVYCRLDSTVVTVTVQGQIAITVATQYYTNTHPASSVKYAFPLSEQASATQLRWKIGQQWYVAQVSGTSQDTSLPGPGGPNATLVSYLGPTPLYFSIPQTIGADSSLAVELTYVELLPYASGSVTYDYPGDYHSIDNSALARQRFSFSLTSPRTIDSINVLSSQPIQSLVNGGNDASVLIDLREAAANDNFVVRYSLNAHQLGLFAYSTTLPDSTVPDTLGGFLTFIAEPDPSSTVNTIPKVFTLIVDQSGSMYGTKMAEARDAASFIVQNLNEGDRFNVIAFTTNIQSFRPAHVPYTAATRDSALAFIAGLDALDLTNISGAFDVAVPQFYATSDSVADIVIFLTDGLPTVGITDTPTLVAHIDSLVHFTERKICVFCFGIGTDADQQLLTLISSHNRGIAEFLENDELFSRITAFYQIIRNPVLLESHIAFDPPIVTEVYPDSLPNLYKGQQMILSGRYRQAGTVRITLSGTAFGRPAAYDYDVNLADSSVDGYQFLPKVWAKRKIESLLVLYYSLSPTTEPAMALKNQIVALSRTYGVISPFTSFTGNVSSVRESRSSSHRTPAVFELLGNYPNPFNPSTTILLKLNTSYVGNLEIRIYNVLGQVVRTLTVHVNGAGQYEVVWDGLSSAGGTLPSGVYFYAVEIQNHLLLGKMIMLK